MSRITEYYEEITPRATAEEITARAKAASLGQKKQRGFRPFAAVAAAAVVMIGGVTAAAATGLLDFNGLFGGIIRAEGSTLEDLTSVQCESFRYEVSDDNYIITPDIIAGADNSVFVALTISRADGKPVADFLSQDIGTKRMFSNFTFSKETYAGGSASAPRIYLDDNGNLTAVCDIDGGTSLDGNTIRIMCSGLYEHNAYFDFVHANDIYCHVVDGNGNYISGVEKPDSLANTHRYYSFSDTLEAEVDDSELSLLDLSWGIEFTYTPDEEAFASLTADVSGDIIRSAPIVFRNGEMYVVQNTERPMLTAEADALALTIGYTLDEADWNPETDGSYRNYGSFSVMGATHINPDGTRFWVPKGDSFNEVYLLTKDGEQIATVVDCAHGDGGIHYLTFHYYEADDSIDTDSDGDPDGNRIAINLDEIEAVSINGTVYPLA